MRVSDVLVAGVVTLAALGGLAVGGLVAPEPLYEIEVFSVAVAIGQGTVLLWRRRYPIAVLLVASAFVAGHLLLHHPNVSSELGPFAAAYAVGAYAVGLRGPIAIAAVAAVAVVLPHSQAGITPGIVVSVGEEAPGFVAAAITNTALLAVSFLLGRVVRAGRESAAARLATALADERTRIARELHDVIAHHVSAMVIHAGAGRRLLDKDDDTARAREAFTHIERSGRAALTAVPMIVGALRGGGGDVASPQPTLQQLDDVTGAATRAGVSVHLNVDGSPRELPPSVDVSAYRILQEAMTNVVKHAGPANVEIRLRYLSDGLEIDVTDDGPGGGSDLPSRQYGLAGMRERVALLGGRFEAGPRPQGGFAVHAWLPVPLA